ncbi:MAG: M56 family metallopeptidase [Gemmatimonadales bacterium]
MSIPTPMAAGALPILLVVLKATAVLLAAMLLAVALHRSSASMRHQVWLVALAGLLILPVIATYLPLGIEVLPAAAASGAEASSSQAAGAVPIATLDRTAPAPAVGDTPSATTETGFWRSIPLGTVLLGVWGVVTLVLLGRVVAGMLAVRRIVRGAVPLDDERWQESLLQIADRLSLDEPPTLLSSPTIHMPFAAGIRRALIVLPADCEQWSTAQREAVLIHELGHVRRKDMIGHTLGRIACALYWFHPLVWTAARRLRDASERACDDLALRLGAVPSDYAQHLLDIVTKVRNPNTPTAAIAMARRKEFEGRMLAILDPDLHRSDTSRWRTALLSVGLAGFVVAVSAAAPARREAKPAPDLAAAHRPTSLPETSDRPRIEPLTERAPAERSRQPAPVRNETSTENPPSEANPIVVPPADQRLRELTLRLDADAGAADASADEKMDLLIRVLRTDQSGAVRRVAAWGLADYAREPAARSELARTLREDADPRVREMAAWALVRARSDEALTALRRALADDGDDAVREVALWGLGSHRDAASLDAITEALRDRRSERVRATAAWAIGTLRPDRAPSALAAMLDASSVDERLKAAWALSEIGDASALPAIRAAIDRTGQDEQVTRALLRALVRSGTSADELSDFLSSASPELRLFAIKAMTGGGAVEPWPWPWPRPIPTP